jgi:hypothetical protein
VVYFYCGPHPWRRANASVLVGIWQVLYLERSAAEAYVPLAGLPPCEEFRDASSGTSLLPLTILDVIQVCLLHCKTSPCKLGWQPASGQQIHGAAARKDSGIFISERRDSVNSRRAWLSTELATSTCMWFACREWLAPRQLVLWTGAATRARSTQRHTCTTSRSETRSLWLPMSFGLFRLLSMSSCSPWAMLPSLSPSLPVMLSLSLLALSQSLTTNHPSNTRS